MSTKFTLWPPHTAASGGHPDAVHIRTAGLLDVPGLRRRTTLLPMSAIERRLHVLVNAARYNRLDAEARSIGSSIGEVVRAAVDEQFAAEAWDVEPGAATGRRLLDSVAPETSTLVPARGRVDPRKR
ncbi:MAG: hypothetical protein ACRCXL_06555 [Dermatophilaceae bacterium]